MAARTSRLTKKQREWRPGVEKAPSSVRMMFASTVLLLEAFVVFFATLAFFGLSVFGASAALKTGVMIGGLVLAALFVADCAFLRKRWGYAAGWVLQIVLVLTGFFITEMFFIGACFLAAWWYSMVTGVRLDREKMQRWEAEKAWRREHGEE